MYVDQYLKITTFVPFCDAAPHMASSDQSHWSAIIQNLLFMHTDWRQLKHKYKCTVYTRL